MQFEFATATRIVFGRGTAKKIPTFAAEMGCRAFVVTGRTAKRLAPMLQALQDKGLQTSLFSVGGEPTTDLVWEGVQKAREFQTDLVIAIGGGSAIDAGKAIAAMITNSGRLEDYLEVVGKGQPITETPAPCIAVPTTAGTGAEVTRNSVIGVPEQAVKVSMRSPMMLPTIAIVDPELTRSMPPAVTASTGLDALTQLIEVFVSRKANPLTDGICREGIVRAGRSLRRAFNHDDDMDAREDMALAGLFGGLALANAKLGAVHGFAGPLGGMIDAPHGVICARLLPHVMEINLRALQQRMPDSPALERYRETAQLVTENEKATASDGVTWIQILCRELAVEPLCNYGLTDERFAEAVEKSQKASSMQGNPITLTDNELTEILSNAM